MLVTVFVFLVTFIAVVSFSVDRIDAVNIVSEANKGQRQLKKIKKSKKPIVCVENVEGNPRTASLFEQGTLNLYNSQYRWMMAKKANKQGKDCTHHILLVEYNINSKHRIRETEKQMDLCSKETPCLITGDEICSYPPHSIEHVIGRFYYSSDYKDMPVFGLGSIIGFNITFKDWPPPGQRRVYMFNFIGSRGANPQKKDRDYLIEELDRRRYGVAAYVSVTERFKVELKNSGEAKEKVEKYRDILLNSDFTLSPVGDHDDCFRFWEAIQAGSIPVFVSRVWGMRQTPKPKDNGWQKKNGEKKPFRYKNRFGVDPLFDKSGRPNESQVEKDSPYPFLCPDGFENVLRTNPPIVILSNWTELGPYMRSVGPGTVIRMRQQLKTWAIRWYRNQTLMADRMINEAFSMSIPEKNQMIEDSEEK
jgi:hypothetical protein